MMKTLVRSWIIGIDKYSWLLLVAAAPFLLFPSPARSLALLVLPVIWLAGWVLTGKPILHTPLNPPLLLMALMVLVSLWATYDLNISLGKVCGVMLGLATYIFFIQRGITKKGWYICLGTFLLCGAGIAGVSLLGTRWIITGKLASLTKITAKLPISVSGLPGAAEGFHPNEVAGALLWVLPVYFAVTLGLIYKFYDTKNNSNHRGMIKPFDLGVILCTSIATLFSLCVFILTQSRTAYFALMIAVGLILWLILPRRMQLGLAMFVIIAIIALTIFITTRGGNVLERFLFESPMDSSSDSLNSIEGRLEIWTRAYECIQDFPWTGMGMNTFRTAVYIVHPPRIFNPNTDVGHAHNEFLQAALDLGVPGLIALIWLYLAAFIQLFRVFRLALFFDREVLFWILGLAGGLIAHLFYGLNDAVALGAKPGFLFWMLLGLIAGIPNWLREPS